MVAMNPHASKAKKVGFVAIVIALICLNVLYAWRGATRDMTETEGIVVAVEQHGKHWHPRVRYEDANGESHTFDGMTRKGRYPDMEEGDHVKVAYETANPERAEESHDRLTSVLARAVLSVGILVFVGDKVFNVF